MRGFVRRALVPVLLGWACLMAGTALPAYADEEPLAPVPTGLSERVVETNGLVARYIRPAGEGKLPAILVLGGSEGGIRGSRQGAIAFAREGYATLAVAYFGTGNLPPNLQNVPLEYFGSALDWMQHEPSIDQRRIAVHGVSKGGEAALLIASRFPIIKAVVAGVPSHVVWQGINFQSWAPKSSWSAAGKDVPFLPYDSTRPFISVLDLYVRSLEFENRFPDAAIPVERINGAVLLISAGDDKLWPSKAMSDRVMARLDANRFAHPHVHLSYADAGHGVASPPARNLAGKYPSNLGGSDAGNAAGRADMWANTLKFLAENLKR